VYRREDLAPFSAAVDQHLQELVSAGRLTKLARHYYAPLAIGLRRGAARDEDLAAASS
jgi:hypothetical protein